MAKALTAENMVQTMEQYGDVDMNGIFEAFRKMRFYGFIDAEEYDKYTETMKAILERKI